MCCVCLPDFQMSDVPPQAIKLHPGVVKTQDPQIERDLHLSLDDLYLGCTKKITISRRVGGELCDSPTPLAQETEDGDRAHSIKHFYLLLGQVMNEDGYGSSIRDKILTIDVKPGWKEGTKIIFPKEGDQVKAKKRPKTNSTHLRPTLQCSNCDSKINVLNVAGNLATPNFVRTICCVCSC